MRKPIRSDTQRFQRELDNYRTTLADLSKDGEIDPFVGKQISFWMESARFFISELEIWDKLGDKAKYYVAVKKVQKALDQVDELIFQLIEEEGNDYEDE